MHCVSVHGEQLVHLHLLIWWGGEKNPSLGSACTALEIPVQDTARPLQKCREAVHDKWNHQLKHSFVFIPVSRLGTCTPTASLAGTLSSPELWCTQLSQQKLETHHRLKSPLQIQVPLLQVTQVFCLSMGNSNSNAKLKVLSGLPSLMWKDCLRGMDQHKK